MVNVVEIQLVHIGRRSPVTHGIGVPAVGCRVKGLGLSILVLLLVFLGVGISARAAPVSGGFESPLDFKQVERIDLLVGKRLGEITVKPNPAASPEVLLRRMYLQIIGRNPTVREFEDFMEMSPSGKSTFSGLTLVEKKRKLIDQLLQSREYGMHEFNFWSEMKNEPDNQNMKLFYFWAWFKKQLNDDLPFDQLVFKMLTETGNIFEGDGVAREFRQNGNFANWFADVMLYFHGAHITCAQCHDHPFDSYNQRQYYEMTAFLRNEGHPMDNLPETLPINKVDIGKIRKRVAGDKELDGRTGALINRFAFWFSKWAQPEKTQKAGVDRLPDYFQSEEAKGDPGQLVRAKVLYGKQPDLRFPEPEEGEDPGKEQKRKVPPEEWSGNDSRIAFAQWLTARDNPRFTLMLANRLWKKTVGIGLFEPANKIKEKTKPSDPELMQALIGLVHQKDFRLKEVYRVIYNTTLFERESSMESVSFSPGMGFPGPVSRRVSAEQMWDNLMVLRNEYVGEFDGEPRPDHPSRLHPYKAYYEKGYLNFDQEQLTEYVLKVGRESRKAGMSALEYENKHLGHGGTRGAVPSPFIQANRDSLNLNGIEYKFLRASELRVPARIDHFLAHFGQSSRKELFGSVREASSTQALIMINWAEKNLFHEKGGILQVVDQREGDEKIRTLFKGTLARLPSEKELLAMKGLVAKSGRVAYRDILWALVNCNEFRSQM
ncbi:MAG: DUF1549 domain-containing protein [Opitutae bacterium]|nr:DUF1549 domain-containing protein [Opitutae bacterium]